ncbi:hypothetical protein M569_14026, partial [Genlisea aurea]
PPSNPASRSTTAVHVTALDGIVTVNSLFTTAVFIGLSLTTSTSSETGNKSSCEGDVELVRRVIVFEVFSFGFFLFSSFIAQSLKLAINLASSSASNTPHHGEVESWLVDYGLFGSAAGSVSGCAFLVASMVEYVQVKLGRVPCSGEAVVVICVLIVLVGSSLLIYVFSTVYVSFFMYQISK